MEELIIRGGTVYDGTGAPGKKADVAVRGGRVSAVGDLQYLNADRVLDASGLAVAPGFIDAHAHSDTSFLRDSSYASKLYQGITTEISGNCGSSPFPGPAKGGEEENGWQCRSFDGFVERFQRENQAMAVNQAMLVGHGDLRAAVIGMEDRPPTPQELDTMCSLLRRDLRAGAWGLSLGLEYAPGFFAQKEELTALGRVVKEFDGLLPAHMRSEGLAIDEAIEELLDIGRATGARVHASHLKLDHFRVHGRAEQVWARLERARREGVSVSADLYPYTASCTTLSIRCPSWSLDGGSEALLRFLQGPRRQEIVEGIRKHYFNAQRAETCLFSDDGGLWPEIIGKNLRQVAEDMLHTADYAQAAADILLRTQGRAWCIFFVMSPEDMLFFLSQNTAIGSDARALPGDPAKVAQKPHPRAYGAIPEFFRLAREKSLCSLEEAVRRVTALPAAMLRIPDRGYLRPGMAADITVFDPQAFSPRATYARPIQLAQGVRHVLVNGGVALQNGGQTALRAGQFLRKTPMRTPKT